MASLFIIFLVVVASTGRHDALKLSDSKAADVQDAQASDVDKLRVQFQVQIGAMTLKFDSLKQENNENQARIQSLQQQMAKSEAETKKVINEQQTKLVEQQTKLDQQQTKIDSLSTQNSALTSQLTDFFTTLHKQRSANNSTNTTVTVGADPIATLQIDATGGVSYVRWGRTSCEGVATSLYRGYAANSRPTYYGGGSDYLCLHESPQWKTIISGVQGGSDLVGVEYINNGPFSTVNNGGQSLAYNDMPCAVCHVQARSHQIMIPGRYTCPAGWTVEYWGYIVASASSTGTGNKKSSFLCVDAAPETVVGGMTYIGNPVYSVESRCSALHCPPYYDGYEPTCVVCSK